ncbi:phosphorylated adapter RNA export protein [Colias croceus]|uniref:phosphorylated adapter RNA export protein n=1 Tax=Colias crocea TaxID=72248 RepID=UPI001E27D552|nr:phosphorylated adapter RNA export protein [Colias croceus]
MMSTTEGELDVEVAQELEDGELEDSDVEEGTYIPLERPEVFNPPSLVNMQIQDEQSDEASLESSGSESDDEPRRRAKRTKLRPRRPQPQAQSGRNNKYNIWCQALQEDLLTEDMVTCDVSKKSRYGVESYDYTIKYRLDDNYISKKVFSSNHENHHANKSHNKRTFSDRSNVKLRLGKRVNSHQVPEEKQNPRLLPDLVFTADDPLESIASEIAEKLAEEKKDLIARIVEVLGASKAIEIYKETQTVEADGGMLVMNGTRRRTSGGVYFFLLKRDDEVSQAMVNKIFNEDRKETARKIKKGRVKSRQKVMEQLKQSLTDSELPSLLSRGEATVQTEHGSNPPPSPATDARECSSDTDEHSPEQEHLPSPARPQSPLPDRTRPLQEYEDGDYLEVMCNDEMDFF